MKFIGKTYVIRSTKSNRNQRNPFRNSKQNAKTARRSCLPTCAASWNAGPIFRHTSKPRFWRLWLPHQPRT